MKFNKYSSFVFIPVILPKLYIAHETGTKYLSLPTEADVSNAAKLGEVTGTKDFRAFIREYVQRCAETPAQHHHHQLYGFLLGLRTLKRYLPDAPGRVAMRRQSAGINSIL